MLSPKPSARPALWRLYVAGLLLAVLAGWQGWQCTDGTMTTPLAGHGIAHGQAHDHPHPPGDTDLASACMSTLETVAASIFVLAVPRPATAGLCAQAPHISLPVVTVRAPALAALGVLRI